MTFTRAEFDQKLSAGELVITFVGMSNVGKSYWSNQLAAKNGFHHICCDDLIEAELGDVMEGLGYKGINDMSKWLGQPYNERFVANQKTYLDLETATLQGVISDLEKGALSGNTIIDTTGSVVHTDLKIRQKLEEHSLVVYLEATSDMQHKMYELYLAEPKPVVWGSIFDPKAGEDPQETLARCYPKLLAYRSGLYAEMSHVKISREATLNIKDSSGFLEHLRMLLPAQAK